MAFFCKCGDKRSEHENPTKSSDIVGKCLAQHNGHPCGCQKYKGDYKRNKRPYVNKFYSELLIFGFAFTIFCIVQSSITLYAQTVVCAFTILILSFYIIYEKSIKPYDRQFKAECLQ